MDTHDRNRLEQSKDLMLSLSGDYLIIAAKDKNCTASNSHWPLW